MRLMLLICLCCSSIATYGSFLDLRIDPTGSYYTVAGIDVSGINSTYYQAGPSCVNGPVQSGLTILGPRPYTCSTDSRDCKVPGATATRNDPSRIIATLIGVRIPAVHLIGYTGWRIQTNNGQLCSIHSSIAPTPVIMAWTSNDTNIDPPVTPVYCSVNGPSVLTHPGQQTTGVSSTVHDTWTVSCSSTSTVTVSTMRDVKLRSASDELDSGLYVESDGVTTADFTVGLTRAVTILSKLKSSTAQPGSYSGSGIITITWP